MSSIKIKQVSITTAPVECIVNAANSQLLMGGGVCGAIFSAAGAQKLQSACNKYKGCPTGEAVITPAFDLKAKYIIHAVGPQWVDGKHKEAEKLRGCYRAALNLAMRHNCHSIAFPLISAGIYGYPKDEAWQVAIDTVGSFQKENSEGNKSDYMTAGKMVIGDEMTDILDVIEDKINYKCWFFGHHHDDYKIGTDHFLLYHQTI